MRQHRHQTPLSQSLERLAPGLYIDAFGLRYFYLSGMYVCVNSSLFRASIPTSPALITDILEELRRDLTGASCIELVD
jgi:hypothetical protein